MRILLDENLDWRLKRHFDAEFDVLAVRDTEFVGLTNGVLLRAAAETFDVLVTLDRNLQH
jgi:predicted nuclease of predicted toxin-antitoxin system